jgi:hypothetical protein
MKNLIKTAIVLLSVFVVTGCTSLTDSNNIPESSGNNSSLQKNPITTPVIIPLTPAEIAGLVQMREEEKLARDVYSAMYAKWNSRVFQNISNSEQTHMSAILNLLTRYSVPDPVGNNAPGVFSDSNIQALYNSLIEKGNISNLEAYKVGIDIEQLDINDLKTQISTTSKTDLLKVYNNLLLGSYSHLEAFTFNSTRVSL